MYRNERFGFVFVSLHSSAFALLDSVTRALVASAIAAPVLFMAAIHTAAAHLDTATRAQCAAQDWPVHQHAAHTEFCRTYLATAD